MSGARPRPATPATRTPPEHLTRNQLIGRTRAAERGWVGTEWRCLYSLIRGESAWNHQAQNPTSTAYGLFQFLDATWAPYGPKTTDPDLQVAYGLRYISARYGTPCRAWAKWNSRSPRWY